MPNKKRLCSVLLLFTFLLSCFQPLIASAEEAESISPIITTDWKEKVEEEQEANFVEKQLSGLLVGLGNTFITLLGAQDVSALVFQRESVIEDAFLANKESVDREKLILNIFPEKFFDGIAKFYDFFIGLLPVPMVLALVFTGLGLMVSMMISPERRTKVKEVLFGIVVMVTLIRFAPWAWEWIIYLNYVVVDGVYAVLSENGVEVKTFLGTIWAKDAYEDITDVENLGIAVMIVAGLFMTFILNYQYMIRMITLAILILIFPFVLISTIIPSRRSALNLWFAEFTSNVFLQAAHALILGIFFFFRTNMADLGIWIVLVMFFGFPAMVDVVRRGIYSLTGEGNGGGMRHSLSNMSGLGSMVAIASMAKSLNKGKAKETSLENAGTGSRVAELNASANQKGEVGQGNTGGSIPLSSGLSGKGSSSASGTASNLAAISKPSQLAGVAKKAGAGAAIGGLAVAGAAISTMATGNGRSGATTGAAAAIAGMSAGSKGMAWAMNALPSSIVSPDGSDKASSVLNEFYGDGGMSVEEAYNSLGPEPTSPEQFNDGAAITTFQQLSEQRSGLEQQREEAAAQVKAAERALDQAQGQFGHLTTRNNAGEVIHHPSIVNAERSLYEAQNNLSSYDNQMSQLAQHEARFETLLGNEGYKFAGPAGFGASANLGMDQAVPNPSPSIPVHPKVEQIQQSINQLQQSKSTVEQAKDQAAERVQQTKANYDMAIQQHGMPGDGSPAHPTVVNAQKAYTSTHADFIKHNQQLYQIDLQQSEKQQELQQVMKETKMTEVVNQAEPVMNQPGETSQPQSVPNLTDLTRLQNQVKSDGRL